MDKIIKSRAYRLPLGMKELNKKKLAFKIKHLFDRNCTEDDDYVEALYDLIAFMSDILERDVNKEKFIKEFKDKYFKIIHNENDKHNLLL